MRCLMGILCACVMTASAEAGEERPAEIVFSEIYAKHTWGTGSDGFGSSGGGSLPHNTVPYRQFLQDFFKAYGIRSVVDLGCGDWEFSRLIKWEGIDYLGYDVVSSLVAKNQQKFGAPNIRFLNGDALSTNLPSADLLICKDVLQHLTNEDILALVSQFRKFKYCLITNDIGNNFPISRGGSRGLDLTLPPFSLKGTKVLSFKSDRRTKEVLLIQGKDL